MIHAADLISTALSHSGQAVEAPDKTTEGVCCVTGNERRCIDRKKLIGPSFTTQGLFKAPDSPLVSVAVWHAFKHRPQRAGHWVCNGDVFMPLPRDQAREAVLRGPSLPPPWSGYITSSFKKHGCLVSPVNHGKARWWAFETGVVNCSDEEAVNRLYGEMCAFLVAGVARQDLANARLENTTRASARVVSQFEQWSSERRGSALHRLIAYLLPGRDALAGNTTDGDSHDSSV